MAATNSEDIKELGLLDSTPIDQVEAVPSAEDSKHPNMSEENPLPSPQQEEETIKKKYGGLLSKKHPLIAKDHERAFFDSADWALGKQGAQKSKGPLEALRPKLQPTPHQQVGLRRPSYASADDSDGDGGIDHDTASENQSFKVDRDNEVESNKETVES